MEFQKLTADCGVYVIGEGPKRTYLSLYDLMLLNKIIEAIITIKGLLGEKFKRKDLGEVKSMLGLEVRRKDKDILLCQEQYSTVHTRRAGEFF